MQSCTLAGTGGGRTCCVYSLHSYSVLFSLKGTRRNLAPWLAQAGVGRAAGPQQQPGAGAAGGAGQGGGGACGLGPVVLPPARPPQTGKASLATCAPNTLKANPDISLASLEASLLGSNVLL